MDRRNFVAKYCAQEKILDSVKTLSFQLSVEVLKIVGQTMRKIQTNKQMQTNQFA